MKAIDRRLRRLEDRFYPPVETGDFDTLNWPPLIHLKWPTLTNTFDYAKQ